MSTSTTTTRRLTYRRNIYPPPVNYILQSNKTHQNDVLSVTRLEPPRWYRQCSTIEPSIGRGPH